MIKLKKKSITKKKSKRKGIENLKKMRIKFEEKNERKDNFGLKG
jgi:hypothetical protein